MNVRSFAGHLDRPFLVSRFRRPGCPRGHGFPISQNHLAPGVSLPRGSLVVKKIAATSRYGLSHDKHSKLPPFHQCWWAAVTYRGLVEL